MRMEPREIIQPGHGVGRASSRNVFNVGNQVLRAGLHPQSNEESFLVYFEDILAEVVLFTNLEGRRVASASGVAWKPVTLVEIKAFIGLLIIAGKSCSYFWATIQNSIYYSFCLYKYYSKLLQ